MTKIKFTIFTLFVFAFSAKCLIPAIAIAAQKNKPTAIESKDIGVAKLVLDNSGTITAYDQNGSTLTGLCNGSTTACWQEFINYTISLGEPAEVECPNAVIYFNGTGVYTNGSATVTGISSTSNMHVGDYVTVRNNAGGGVLPSFTRIATINSATSITLNKNATASGTAPLTVSNTKNFFAASNSIYFPPFENWYFHVKSCNLTFAPSVTGPAIFWDSFMASQIFWDGVVVYQPSTFSTANSVMEFKPRNPVPLDGITVGTSSYFRIAAPVANANSQTVIHWDLSVGSVRQNTWDFVEVNGNGSGFLMHVNNATSTTVFDQNLIEAPNAHGWSSSGAAIVIAGTTTNQANYRQNTWTVYAENNGTGGCIGTWGQYDSFNGGCTNASQGLVFNTGSNYNHYNYSTKGVTTPFVDNGAGNRGWIN